MVQVIRYQPEAVLETPTQPYSPFLNVDAEMVSGLHTGFVQLELFKMLRELRKLKPETKDYDSLVAQISMWQEAITIKRGNGEDVPYDSESLTSLITENSSRDSDLDLLESRLKDELGLKDLQVGQDFPKWTPTQVPPVSY